MKTRKPKSSQVMQRSPSTPYKIVLLGQTGTGKSSIALKYALNKFREDIPQEATIGCAYFQKTLQRGNKSVTLNIWDTAGHCRFDTLIPMYSQGARAAIVVYDISHLESFHRAQQFLMTMKTDVIYKLKYIFLIIGIKLSNFLIFFLSSQNGLHWTLLRLLATNLICLKIAKLSLNLQIFMQEKMNWYSWKVL